MDVEGGGIEVYLNLLHRYSPGETEENHDKPHSEYCGVLRLL